MADTLRLATFHADLTRDGPGLMLRDLMRDEDAQITATLDVIAASRADIVVLQRVDHDPAGHTLARLQERLADHGAPYPFAFAGPPNAGRASGLDLDNNGRLGEARDALGYGRFTGQGGMAILSRYPIDTEALRDFTAFAWRDLPDSAAPNLLSPEALQIMPLASVAAWDVPVLLPGGTRFHVYALHATTPVFDGPEDRNGHRNADELRFWRLYLEGWAADGQVREPTDTFALIGTLNLDPDGGEGRRAALLDLLSHPMLQDPRPVGQAGGLATADWPDPVPGDLRVDYILPAAGLRVLDQGVIWPLDDTIAPGLSTVQAASDHRLVWVDLALP